jgi:hypothetical protein
MRRLTNREKVEANLLQIQSAQTLGELDFIWMSAYKSGSWNTTLFNKIIYAYGTMGDLDTSLSLYEFSKKMNYHRQTDGDTPLSMLNAILINTATKKYTPISLFKVAKKIYSDAITHVIQNDQLEKVFTEIESILAPQIPSFENESKSEENPLSANASQSFTKTKIITPSSLFAHPKNTQSSVSRHFIWNPYNPTKSKIIFNQRAAEIKTLS